MKISSMTRVYDEDKKLPKFAKMLKMELTSINIVRLIGQQENNYFSVSLLVQHYCPYLPQSLG